MPNNITRFAAPEGGASRPGEQPEPSAQAWGGSRFLEGVRACPGPQAPPRRRSRNPGAKPRPPARGKCVNRVSAANPERAQRVKPAARGVPGHRAAVVGAGRRGVRHLPLGGGARWRSQWEGGALVFGRVLSVQDRKFPSPASSGGSRGCPEGWLGAIPSLPGAQSAPGRCTSCKRTAARTAPVLLGLASRGGVYTVDLPLRSPHVHRTS
jgi:hypothetical protein